jgi:hypothetical protein
MVLAGEVTPGTRSLLGVDDDQLVLNTAAAAVEEEEDASESF